jgi:hypothetical protein
VDWRERFWAATDRGGNAECWEWRGRRDQEGYGIFWMPRPSGQRRAHRIAYALLIGPVPYGLTIDHLCRNRGCVNPAHMEPVTIQENLRRRPRPHACVNGHPFTDANTHVRPSNGKRECRECMRARKRAYDLPKPPPVPTEMEPLFDM